MKMVLAIIDKEDTTGVMQNLIKEGFSVTTLSSTGGFLRSGNVTILVGANDERLQDVITVIKEHSKTRNQQKPDLPGSETDDSSTIPAEVAVSGATVFVLNVEKFEKI